MFNGQVEQDKFVLSMLNNKKNGFFLELGSNHPINSNNTFILEKEYNWNGIMIEYDNYWLNEYKIHRPNSIHVIGDAQQINYSLLLKTNNVPQNIDYLQIDLDVDNSSTLNTLLKIDDQLLSEYKFATITFEHDIYSSDHENDIWGITRKKSREIFENRGYVLIFPDVQLPSNTSYRGKQCGAFEDWYVHPDLVDIDLINKYKTDKSIFFKDITYY
jgi:hypothetical protein